MPNPGRLSRQRRGLKGERMGEGEGKREGLGEGMTY